MTQLKEAMHGKLWNCKVDANIALLNDAEKKGNIQCLGFLDNWCTLNDLTNTLCHSGCLLQAFTRLRKHHSHASLFSNRSREISVTGEKMEITFFPERGSNPGRLRDRPTLYRVAIKASLYRKAVQVYHIPIPGDIPPFQLGIRP